MSYMRSVCATLAVVLLVLFAAGCSRSGLKTVTGKVTLDGVPLEGAELRFVPKEDLTLGEFGGRTGADGTFSITVGGPGMSAKPGTYVVVITKGERMGVTRGPKSEDELKEAMKGTAPGMSGQNLPARYGSKETSPFIAEIKEGKTELEPYELRTKP